MKGVHRITEAPEKFLFKEFMYEKWGVLAAGYPSAVNSNVFRDTIHPPCLELPQTAMSFPFAAMANAIISPA